MSFETVFGNIISILSLIVTVSIIILSVRKLTENPGETVSRDALLECCWDTTGEYLDVNTLSVHIKRIREKLGENDKEGHIRTVRGEGYVFASSK